MDQPSAWFGGLIDGSQGDVLYATQLSTKTSAGVDYFTVTRFASFTGVQQVDGTPTDVSGAFTDVTPTETVGIDFPASQFAALATAVNPGATGDGAAFDLATLPGAAVAGDFGIGTDLLLIYPGEADATLGLVDYGVPFPTAWGTTVYAGETFTVSYTAPGASGPATQYGSVTVTMPPEKVTAAGPLVPQVSPVQKALVDGQSAFGTLEGISLTPTLSWSPPAIGTPNAYSVTVSEVLGTAVQYVAELVTTTTSVPLPPNVLQSGHAYVFTITAEITPFDPSTQPFHAGTTYASADLLTGLALP